ncbi:MutS-related protein [Peptoniphilus mikwangii]|uniref:MutS-related protein n=1 Tax=Peptoniphilus mikwangii TaxID=1354300 RepID=UPI0004247FD9|nr:hypothetical protein [Peptoniphilus mikwangii]
MDNLKMYDGLQYFLFIIIFIIGFLFIAEFLRKAKYLRLLREKVYYDFGRSPSDDNRNLKVISKLYELGEKSDYTIDDITFNDLNMDSVFRKFDHTKSTIGSQYLFKFLRSPVFNKAHHDKLKSIREYFIENEEQAKEIQLEFAKVGNFKRDIIQIFYEGIDYERFAAYKLPTYVLSFSVPLILIAGYINKGFGIIAGTCLILLNIYFSNKMKKATLGRVLDFINIYDVLLLAKDIENINCDVISEELDRIREINVTLKSIRKKVGSARIASNSQDTDLLKNLIDVLIMYNARNFFKTADAINLNRDILIELYELLGKIEVYIAMTSLYLAIDAKDVEYVDEDFCLSAKNLRHPLLNRETQVPSNFNFDYENVLITGSNASGKSTFLRSISISNIMAMTLGFVMADEYRTSMFYLQSAIDIRDSIEESMSYFLAETLAIKRMIDESKVKKLVVLDEIFKGTNTVDRISAAYNTLKYLANDRKIIAATHDIELTNLLKDTFKNYHFEEEIKDDDILFDYIIRKGPAISRNAIEILRVKGYPDEIVNNARKMAEELFEEKL